MSLDPARMIPMANAIRALSMDAVQKAQSGHPGMPMGMADVATVLWSNYLKYDASAPDWADRDRFVLSAGHGSMLLYSLLNLSGFAKPTIEDIENFRQLGSPRISCCPVSNAPPAHWGRASRWQWAWRWPSGISTPSSAMSWSIITPG
mgnify:CR=1 FL=1